MSGTESHSARFGLNPQDESVQNSGGGSQSGIEEDYGHTGHRTNERGPAGIGDTESKVGGMAEGGGDHTRPGAGSSTLTPSQGTGKIGGQVKKRSILNRLNPFKT